MSGMTRKGLFNCIVIVKDVHGFVYIFGRITKYDVINNVVPGGKRERRFSRLCFGFQ